MLNHYETGGVQPHQIDVMNKCQQCGATWIGARRALCMKCASESKLDTSLPDEVEE